jgi:hypothetical protein
MLDFITDFIAGAGSGGMCGVVLGIVLYIALVQFEILRSGDPSGAGALEALVPDYLERVDATSWTYGGGGGVFQLYFSARLSGILTETWKYDSRNKKW